jgi:acyl-CoA dehydrogenase
VPTSAPGIEVESIIRMHGHIGGYEGITVFDEVKVEPWQLVGELHNGFKIGLLGVSMGRIYNSARAVGLAGRVLPSGRCGDGNSRGTPDGD